MGPIGTAVIVLGGCCAAAYAWGRWKAVFWIGVALRVRTRSKPGPAPGA